MDGVSTLTTPGHVYFIRATQTGMVKIGWATKPEERLRLLQRASPDRLYIAASKPGNGHDERELHRRFAMARKHGEWFEPVTELLTLIEAVKTSAHGPYRPAVEKPAPIVLEPRQKRKPRPEAQGPAWPPPSSYWDYGNPGWDRLVEASMALG